MSENFYTAPDGTVYKAKAGGDCIDCHLRGTDHCGIPACCSSDRADERDVVFVRAVLNTAIKRQAVFDAAEKAGVKFYPAQFSGVMVADNFDEGKLFDIFENLGIEVMA